MRYPNTKNETCYNCAKTIPLGGFVCPYCWADVSKSEKEYLEEIEREIWMQNYYEERKKKEKEKHLIMLKIFYISTGTAILVGFLYGIIFDNTMGIFAGLAYAIMFGFIGFLLGFVIFCFTLLYKNYIKN